MIRGMVYGHRQLILRQQLIGHLATQAPAIHEEIGEKLTRAFYVNHAHEGGDLPVGFWPPLAASTVRRKKFYKDTLLHETGKMQGAWRYRSSGRMASIWNNMLYANYHQTGTSRMPARKLIPAAPWLVAYAKAIVLRYFDIALGHVSIRGRGSYDLR